jgi:hypothetical protein
MKVKVVFGSLVLAGLTLAGLSRAASRETHIVCSEDLIPSEMVVTATGTSPVCRGSCRARRIEEVRGPIMIICAKQPVPQGYTLDSITTTPDCQCLGDEDNAYVIKKREGTEGQEEGEMLPTPTSTPTPNRFPTPIPWESQPDFRTGD